MADEKGTGVIAVVTNISAVIVKTIQLILLILLGWFVIWNYPDLEKHVLRFFQEASEISVAGFTISTERVNTPSSSSGSEMWATYDRVSSPLTIDLVQFDQDAGHEYFDVVAREQVDLTGGYVGDDNCAGSAGTGERALRVSVDAALRAGIFKALGSFDPMGFWDGHGS